MYDTQAETPEIPVATLTNEYDPLGKLQISKVVTSGDEETAFTVKVTLEKDEAAVSGAFDATVSDGESSWDDTVTFDDDGEATFEIYAGETWLIEGLPAGATYTVTEVDLPSDWVLTTDEEDLTGEIPVYDEETAEVAIATLTNEYAPGSLKIHKIVSGSNADKNKEFTFTVTFSIDGEYSYSGSKSGTISSGGTIKLKHDESVTIVGIPDGCEYTVVESDNEGYTVSWSGDTGTIHTDIESLAECTNSDVPGTGDEEIKAYIVLLMAVSFLGLMSVMLLKKRNDRKQRADY